MLMQRYLALSLVLTVVLFGLLLLRLHSDDSSRLSLRSPREQFVGTARTGGYLDAVVQRLKGLEERSSRIEEYLNGILGRPGRDHRGDILHFDSLQSSIDQIHLDMEALLSFFPSNVTTSALAMNITQELTRVYSSLLNLKHKLSQNFSTSETSESNYLSAASHEKFNTSSIEKTKAKAESRKGTLVCNGRHVDSEVVYWKVVPGDADYESPYRRKNKQDKKFMTFKYDPAGYNNIRMSLESLAVLAHAMGRVFVIPPDEHEELLRPHSADVAKRNEKLHRESSQDMGVDDIFNMSLLRSQRGFSTMTMDEFIQNEAMKGRIKGVLPPPFEGNLRGNALWTYLISVADLSYGWHPKFFVFDDHDGNLQVEEENTPRGPLFDRLHAFFGQDQDGRGIINYNKVNKR